MNDIRMVITTQLLITAYSTNKHKAIESLIRYVKANLLKATRETLYMYHNHIFINAFLKVFLDD